MIPLTVTQALAFYSLLLGAMVLGMWVYTELNVRRPQRGLGKQYLWRCPICAFTYLDDKAHESSECPQCATILYATDEGAREVVTTDGRRVEEPAGPKQDVRRGSKRKRPNASRRGPRRRR